MTIESAPGRTGLVYNLPNDQYHGNTEEISCSGLKDMARSPFHFYSLHRDPSRPPKDETDGQLHGTLAHCAILEPDQFPVRYVWTPGNAPRRPTDAQWRAKNPSPDSVSAMIWWGEFAEKNQGKQIILAKEYDTAMRQGDSVRKNPEAREILTGAKTEVSAFWNDPDTGVRCRCRPDAVKVFDEGVILGDVKTYSDASAYGFKLQVERMQYDMQDAFYSMGFELAAGVPVLGFVFIAVEVAWPHACAVHMLDDDSRKKATEAVRIHLDRYAECMRTGVWPSYPTGVNLLSVRSRTLNRV